MATADIRYRQLGYIALNVTDLARSAAFYETTVGLTRAGEGDGLVYLRCSDKHHDIMLVQSAVAGLKRVGWEMENPAALQALIESIGLPVQQADPAEARALGVEQAYRFTEPTTGTTFEAYTGMARAAAPYMPTHTKIARLGHIVIISPDRMATAAFMADKLNFRISDQIDETVTFMRCFPNPFHHSFGVGQGRDAHLGHVNFMVTEIDDIGKAQWRMKRAGAPVVFGPGRHPPSDSIFFYFLDPDGLTLEYSFGMEEFPEHAARPPRAMKQGLDSIDYWGAVPEPGFSALGVIETL